MPGGRRANTIARGTHEGERSFPVKYATPRSGGSRLACRAARLHRVQPASAPEMSTVPADADGRSRQRAAGARSCRQQWRRRSTWSGRRVGPADRIAVVGGGLLTVGRLSPGGFRRQSRWSTLRRRAPSSRVRSGRDLRRRVQRAPTSPVQGECHQRVRASSDAPGARIIELLARPTRFARQRSACRLRPGLSASASPAGLATALRLAGEASVVELSWWLRRRRGAARRSAPQPPPAAHFEPVGVAPSHRSR
jgi:hypothetical protein